jgi:hypothetical protein
VGALTDAKVGEYINKHFVSTFQKVGSFRVVGNQKQGGNVATYLCTPNGGILDAVAGPVNASTMLREARWVVENRKTALLDSQGDVYRYKQFFRVAHADLLPAHFGPGTVDWQHMPMYQPTETALVSLLDQGTGARQLNQEQRVHLLLAAYPLVKLDQAYKVVYEKIVGEKISTRPVAEGKGGLPPDSGARLAMAPKGWDPLAPKGWDPLTPTVRPSRPGSMPLTSSPPAPPPPTAEELREQSRAKALASARENQSESVVCGATTLNTLLEHLQELRDQGATLQSVPLSADVLAHINVSRDKNGPTNGLLREGGRLHWPLAWRAQPLAGVSEVRQVLIEDRLTTAITQVKAGQLNAELWTKLNQDVAYLQGVLDDALKQHLSTDVYAQANRYIKQVRDAVNILGREDAVCFVDGTYTPDPERIKNVSDLVSFMSAKRLKFAPAVSGDESAYLDLHKALVTCDTSGAIVSGNKKNTPLESGEL